MTTVEVDTFAQGERHILRFEASADIHLEEVLRHCQENDIEVEYSTVDGVVQGGTISILAILVDKLTLEELGRKCRDLIALSVDHDGIGLVKSSKIVELAVTTFELTSQVDSLRVFIHDDDCTTCPNLVAEKKRLQERLATTEKKWVVLEMGCSLLKEN